MHTTTTFFLLIVLVWLVVICLCNEETIAIPFGYYMRKRLICKESFLFWFPFKNSNKKNWVYTLMFNIQFFSAHSVKLAYFRRMLFDLRYTIHIIYAKMVRFLVCNSNSLRLHCLLRNNYYGYIRQIFQYAKKSLESKLALDLCRYLCYVVCQFWKTLNHIWTIANF